MLPERSIIVVQLGILNLMLRVAHLMNTRFLLINRIGQCRDNPHSNHSDRQENRDRRSGNHKHYLKTLKADLPILKGHGSQNTGVQNSRFKLIHQSTQTDCCTN